jgi:hypothetical protein
MLNYTRVWLKAETKNCDRKYLRDQKLLKLFIDTKNKIRDILVCLVLGWEILILGGLIL